MSGATFFSQWYRLIRCDRVLLNNCYSKPQTRIMKYSSAFRHQDMKIVMTKHPKIGEYKNNNAISEIGPGKIFSDHMLRCYWNENVGWKTPNILPYSDIPLSPASGALQYGVQCFEEMGAYYGVDGKIRLFQPIESMKQLNKSAHAVALPEFDIYEYLECVKKLIQVDQLWVPEGENDFLYIQSTIIGTEPSLFPLKSDKAALLYCITSPHRALALEPVSIYADPQFVRTWKGSVGSDASIGGNYCPILRYQSLAKSLGCNDVLWLYGPNEQLTEVGAMENVFVHWINEDGDNEIATPSLDGRIVFPGVMRSSLLELGSNWDCYQIVERQITLNDIKKAVKENRVKEMFATEKTCVVRPINKIVYQNEDILIPSLETGLHATNKFHREITDIQYGRRADEHKWCEVVD